MNCACPPPCHAYLMMRIGYTEEDKLFSQYIRKKSGGVCAKCEKYYGWKRLQASHYIGRRNKAVRWDEDNVVAHCFTCHMYLTENPHEHKVWKAKQLGARKYRLLLKRAIPIMKWTDDDKKKLRAKLREKIKILDIYADL